MLLREKKGPEIARLGVQFCLFGGIVVWWLVSAEASRLGESPATLPHRLYEDTFGPIKGLLQFEGPPLMDRARFERPQNVWHDLMFQNETIFGYEQDCAISMWNWGANALWQGGWFSKLAAMATGCCLWTPILVMCAGIPQFCFMLLPNILPAFVKGFYLRWMPSVVLTLDQLITAHKQYGRTLGVGYMAEVELASRKSEGPCASTADADSLESGEVGCASRRRNLGQ